MNKFTKEFKERAVKLKEQGVPSGEIFENEGINIKNKQKDYTSKLISRWKSKKQQEKILDSKEVLLLKKIKKEEDKKRIEYLEAQVAYLKAEKDFLVKLPKKKKN